MKWTEISNLAEVKRYKLLSDELKLSNFENSFVSTKLPNEFCDLNFFASEDNCDRFRAYTNQLKKDFDQILVGGFFKDRIDLFSHEYPAELLQIKVLDSIVKVEDHWWPRNQLYHAFVYLMTHEVKRIDFSAAVLIVGANADSKSIIAALIKLGFSHFNITDINPEKCQILLRELQRCYFSVHFDMTEIGYVTQLTNTFSIGVNTLFGELDETTKMAVIYFNFLIKGGFWIEICPSATSVLANEATSFGFSVWSGVDLVSNLDYIWARSALKCEIDLARLKQAYRAKLF